MNSYKYLIVPLIISTLLVLASCTRHAFVVKKKVNLSVTEPVITIWIHGTKFLPDKLFRNRLFARPGLHPVLSYDRSYALRRRAEMLCAAHPKKFQLHHFYLFGWSGKLSSQERIDAAKQLYSELSALIYEYEDWLKCTPKIRIVTHSHGGNVATNLANQCTPENQLCIDELVLLACPVQEQNKHCITSPIFKKIYHIFSTFDMVQIMDPQGLYRSDQNDKRIKRPFFSQRTFDPQPNLIQTKIKINGRGIGHLDFIFEKFMPILPDILKQMDTWYEGQPKETPKEPWLFHLRT